MFGKYAVIDSVTHNFEKEPSLYWKIKPPSSGDELNMSKFLIQGRVVVGPDGVRREFPPTDIEIAHRELALTFAGTNLPMSETKVEEGGEPYIKVGLSVEGIEACVRLMPHELVMEIWKAIGVAVPGWGASPLDTQTSPGKKPKK